MPGFSAARLLLAGALLAHRPASVPGEEWSWWELIGQAAVTVAFLMLVAFCCVTRRLPAVWGPARSPENRKSRRTGPRRGRK